MSRIATNPRRSGVAMAYVVVAISVGLAIASLAVDYGRVQMAKTQLRVAADAAARAAVTKLGTTFANVQDIAAQYAAANTCDGQSVTIDKNNDVEFIDWNANTRTATVLTGNSRNFANAVRVTCRREGNSGIPLNFAWMSGRYYCNAHGVAICAIIPPGFGLVGIDFITLKGNSSASYWSSTGVVGGNAGNIASNGNITSVGNANINGTLWTLPASTVSGVTANARRDLTSMLNYPNGSSGSYTPTVNDNSLLPSGMMGAYNVTVNNKTYNVPAGIYYCNNINVGATGVINCLGPVTFYCYGAVSMSGQMNTASNLPANLRIEMIPNPSNGTAPGAVNIGSNATLYADLYAPQSAITLSGNGAIYGQIVGKSVTMSGNSDIYYDLSLAGGNGVVQVVQ